MINYSTKLDLQPLLTSLMDILWILHGYFNKL